ncbi:type II toxin-antitoxin system antitoxin DNA ADP-ribosyl glycohydrolase DarG [Dongia rigui]|uniref:Macro domain-containing protein n=1 Tax=Dongia rigui TaxID=940149 RepID=A0ABU5E394_9PROT|nr:macro domain-containing protein [Dongia rigui]MDY0874094.1 macro domain-containing protein [Dongia rigui]
MIEIGKGNLLEAEVDALVNTVNCDGFMGKGIALQFKQAFPRNFKAYEEACKLGRVVPGEMLIFDNGGLLRPRYIVNFPTKRHWRNKSLIEDIQFGLEALVKDVELLNIQSIALPPLGCGLGGLRWADVRPLIESAFAKLPHVKTIIFEPKGAPSAKAMPVRTERPKMTPARALFIKLMQAYSALDYSRTLLEVQKLAYFLQVAGEPLKLKYAAGHYGPYAQNLNKVLEAMEGHFTRGYGDSQKPNAEIELLPGADEEASDFLSEKPDSIERLQAVSDLIEGFETPYGMELLATVHWAAHSGGPKSTSRATTPQEAVVEVHEWNPRKKAIFKPEHIHVAWKTLEQRGWMSPV